jgi:hypothetical protein
MLSLMIAREEKPNAEQRSKRAPQRIIVDIAIEATIAEDVLTPKKSCFQASEIGFLLVKILNFTSQQDLIKTSSMRLTMIIKQSTIRSRNTNFTRSISQNPGS